MPNAASYTLYYSVNGSLPSDGIGQKIENATSPCVITDLVNGNPHVFRLRAPRVSKKERLVSEVGFVSPAELAPSIAEFEGWSQICIRAICDGSLRL